MALQQQVRQKYRSLGRMLKLLPEDSLETNWEKLRDGFRQPLSYGETVESRLKDADDRLAFLRIVTPKSTYSHQGSSDGSNGDDGTGSGGGNSGGGGGGRWIYKDGKRYEINDATMTSSSRDAGGRVHTNWDGKNLDPCSVKRHNHQLKRAGFVNNAHAKGIF